VNRYQVRLKYSAIRTWTVEAGTQKEAEEKARANFNLYLLRLWKRQDKLRTLSVRKEAQS
jgi:hypothetical protein